MNRRTFLKGLMAASGLAATRPIELLDSFAYVGPTTPNPIDLSLVNDLLAKFYKPAIVAQLNQENPLLRHLRGS